ncbi:MAG TPA: aldehyde ferredoxin oxidoreductase C-terminal domain-containing protein, partial [Smithella sp.]|nr:aldehyde ferredoxin oxidoreductase C-terminal domain-containing protein [Smithella sp.]
ENEKDYNDAQVSAILNKTLEEIRSMPAFEKRRILMDHRRKELKKLISVYYVQRGWNESGIPKIETLKHIGLWEFLNDETRERIASLNEKN